MRAHQAARRRKPSPQRRNLPAVFILGLDPMINAIRHLLRRSGTTPRPINRKAAVSRGLSSCVLWRLLAATERMHEDSELLDGRLSEAGEPRGHDAVLEDVFLSDLWWLDTFCLGFNLWVATIRWNEMWVLYSAIKLIERRD